MSRDPSPVPAPRPPDEAARQRAVERLGVLDTPREQSLDDLVQLASFICGTPIAVVGLIDNERQWFKAECGLGGSESPRDLTFCGHAILDSELMEVPDATRDPRFAGNPFVLGEPHVRFYAGVPLVGEGAHAYGTLCVVDHQPRALNDGQRDALVRLARQAVAHLEMHRSRREARATRDSLAHLLDSMPDGLVSCLADGTLDHFNEAARQWHGVDPRDLPQAQWAEHFDLFTPDGSRHLEVHEIPLVRAHRGETVRDVEILIKPRNSAPHSVLCNASQLFGADGEPTGAVCVLRDVTELRSAEARLRDSELRMRAVLKHSYDAFVAVDEAGRVLEWNPAAESLFGWSADEASGRPMSELLVPPVHRAAHEAGMRRVLEGGGPRVLNQRLQLPAMHRSGREFPVELTISLVELPGRRMFTAFLHDVSQRVETEARLRASEARLRAITDNAPALIAYVDREERFQFANVAFGEWYGVDPDSIIGCTVDEVRGPEIAARMRPHMQRALAGECVALENDVQHATLGPRHCQLTLIPDRQGDVVLGYHVMAYDITAQRQLTHVLKEQALRDELTGLPNRAAWNEELRRSLARSSRLGQPAAVMFLDLDGFKDINDTHGHAAGDLVLKTFAARLRQTLRAGDLVARLAGDEFVVFLDRVADVEGDPPRVARKILEATRQPVAFGDHLLQVAASIGIGIQRGPDFDADGLVRCADEAMYAAKRGRRGGVQVRECAGFAFVDAVG